jgi:hypothetical protein
MLRAEFLFMEFIVSSLSSPAGYFAAWVCNGCLLEVPDTRVCQVADGPHGEQS